MNEPPESSVPSDVYVPPGGPPQEPGPSREIYARMGAANIFRMCEDFYAELERSAIRALFSEDMKAASRGIAEYFVGLLGGPPIYQQKYGPPQLRARHLAFPIEEQGRQVWLSCFRRVLEQAEKKYDFPKEHLPGFVHFLEAFSAWMVNRKVNP